MTLWTGSCASRGIALLGVGLALVLGAIGIGTVIALRGSEQPSWVGWFVAAVGLATGVATYVASSVQATLTEDTFTVAFGPVHRPRRVIPLADIAEASAIVVEPLEWGGWGYRWIPRRRASAAVVRRGPGIHLALRDGRQFVVTIDDAVQGAKLTSAALIGAGRT